MGESTRSISLKMNRRIIVVGGEYAGMMAAGTAARLGGTVCLFEKNKILGKKLLITGKGRCNVTNFCDVKIMLLKILQAQTRGLCTGR